MQFDINRIEGFRQLKKEMRGIEVKNSKQDTDLRSRSRRWLISEKKVA